MKLDIIRIGNSRGIRLPKAVLEQCGFGEAVELEVRGQEIVLRTAKRPPREGWAEAFQRALEKNGPPKSEMLLGEFANEFDETEWTWPENASQK